MLIKVDTALDTLPNKLKAIRTIAQTIDKGELNLLIEECEMTITEFKELAPEIDCEYIEKVEEAKELVTILNLVAKIKQVFKPIKTKTNG